MTKNFLFEIGTEEIPAGAMPSLLKQVEALASAYVKEERLAVGHIDVFGTPRRIALIVKDIAEKAEDLKERYKGPSVSIAFDENNKPTKAAIGFAKGKGIAVEDLVVEDGYIYAETSMVGRDAKEIVTSLMSHIINRLSFPKSMRWGDYDERFIRPVRWFVALLDDEVIPFSYASAESTKMTRGHRFLGKKLIEIESPLTYVEQLKENFIIVNQTERKALIVQQLEAIAEEKKGSIIWDEDLLEEVLYLVEYPTALCGTFDDIYLSLPTAAAVTPMKDHQRYFPIVDEAGKLMAMFLTVRNGNEDYIKTVQAGNERVLRARLEDARFFFNEDRKKPLCDRLEGLEKIVFQEGLGNMRDKTNRLIELTDYLADACHILQNDKKMLERACLLSKTDLTTGMVTEFTELQGLMGKEYALLDKEDPMVSEAIFEQYLPRFAGDQLPESECGKMISLCDKIDNIVATFSRGLIPTGSQDPYALRRQTIGILNILIQSPWNVALEDIFVKSAQLLHIEEAKMEELLENLKKFFSLRLKNIYLDRQWPHEVIDLLLSRPNFTVHSNESIGQALLTQKIYEDEELIQGYTRIYNLVKEVTFVGINESLLKEDAEKELYEKAKAAYRKSKEALQAEKYEVIVAIPKELVGSINNFFEAVMVMDKDESIKNNRLQLLRMVYETFLPMGEVVALK